MLLIYLNSTEFTRQSATNGLIRKNNMQLNDSLNIGKGWDFGYLVTRMKIRLLDTQYSVHVGGGFYVIHTCRSYWVLSMNTLTTIHANFLRNGYIYTFFSCTPDKDIRVFYLDLQLLSHPYVISPRIG